MYLSPLVHLLLQYMLRFNDIRNKQGVDLAEHLIAYYHAQDT